MPAETPPPAETRLDALLAGMRPRRMPGQYAFVCLPGGSAIPAEALASFREREGLTLVLPLAEAESIGCEIMLRAAWIVLEVNSSLEACGFTAAFSRALGEAGIACNVLAAVHHDHLFVPIEQADRAMQVLHTLQAQAGADVRGR
ncbi:ACT domain-containing protein [Pseudomarimonas salicorniae]|uniref:ACT domain-containing protein n=1 Tax=Pseudomarimonas salicorniae TaxID=2933270 RepID=A0ABT0GF95_9GAMM|nr:ACT domain-containing protein [Lysobacter sp. CAU 1642]MCK7593201.1 ACT domain-containing protein [Lysobacter sp. CAU 1642]